MNDPRRAIPSTEAVLSAPEMATLLRDQPRARVVSALRAVQDAVRLQPTAQPRDIGWYIQETAARLAQLQSASLRRVINATGVVLHTNLGRAPLSDDALLAMFEAARDYSNLEYDLTEGARGSRYTHCTDLLRELTGAEDALVVNNNAAALVLVLNTFARDREAIVSRGELVEIGGSFRVPAILERSGARLREVGSTNRTHLRDYADAIGAETGALVKVHRSNFAMSGFVSEVAVEELAELARDRGTTLIHDLGSGLLDDLSDVGLTGEPTVHAAVAAARGGVVTLSGDKLLGGPQAGILLGTTTQIAAMRGNPLCRALRVDKLTLAALAATLRTYAQGNARTDIPVLRMLRASRETIEARAQALQQQLAAAGIGSSVEAGSSAIGGGAFPDTELPTHLVFLDAGTPVMEIDARLRANQPPVIARIQHNRLAIDLRTVNEPDEPTLCQALVDAVRE
jgi:L-seryl-tRNA(Ser) seleniumtransferase